MTALTNNELTDDVLEYVLAVVEDRYENRKSNAGEDDRIILALRELQKRRKASKWPEPKDGEPRLHIKEQPVPIVPEKMSKHALFEVAIARFSKMNEGFPIKRFKADWVISWMLENFPPVAQKQGDN